MSPAPAVPPRPPSSVAPELAELIRISRIIGADPDWVQGGGGNTSVKTFDRKTMFVKASGTLLADMDETRGWAELDLPAALDLLATPGLTQLAAKAREDRVLSLLCAAARRPAGVRPSVEASLHALLERVVVHSHPVQLTAFLCSRDSRESWSELLAGVGERRTLYVPYVDPGWTLAARLETDIAAFERKNGNRPQVVLLENHGLFVAAPTAEECLELHDRVAAAGRRWAGRERVNPRQQFGPRAPSRRAAESLAPRVRGALLRGGAQPCVVALDRSEIAAEVAQSESLLAALESGAFTPDLIVYCRTYPVVLRGDDAKDWEKSVADYRARNGLDPRVVLVPRHGVFHVGTDLHQLRVVAETHRLGMAALICSARGGGPRFLDRRQAHFIEEWEVEKYRAALVNGGPRPLAGRIAFVLGERTGVAATAMRALADAGAVTSLLLDAVAAESSGLDVVVDTVRALGPGVPLFNSLLTLFAEQGAGGEIVVLGANAGEVERLAVPARLAKVRVRSLPSDGEVGADLVELLRAGR